MRTGHQSPKECRRPVAPVSTRPDERETLKALVIKRTLSAFTRLTDDLSTRELRKVVNAPSDVETAALGLQIAQRVMAVEDPLFAARLRGLEAKKRLEVEAGGFLKTGDVQKLLNGISAAAITKRCDSHKLLVVRAEPRGNLFPRLQFDDRRGELLRWIPDVLPALAAKGAEGWGQLAFLLNDNDRLDGRRPIDLLREGDVSVVLEAARNFGEHGAA